MVLEAIMVVTMEMDITLSTMAVIMMDTMEDIMNMTSTLEVDPHHLHETCLRSWLRQRHRW